MRACSNISVKIVWYAFKARASLPSSHRRLRIFSGSLISIVNSGPWYTKKWPSQMIPSISNRRLHNCLTERELHIKPVSSKTSRMAARRGLSSNSTLPPGKFQMQLVPTLCSTARKRRPGRRISIRANDFTLQPQELSADHTKNRRLHGDLRTRCQTRLAWSHRVDHAHTS